MKTLYIECNMGAAGDMLMAALLELLPEKERFLDKVNALGLDGVRVRAEPSVKCGIAGTHVSVFVGEAEETSIDVDIAGRLHHGHDHGGSGHDHDSSGHDHGGNGHSHHHAEMRDIHTIVSGLPVSESVKEHTLGIYNLLAEAEAHAHGVPITEVHFHEVGNLDAITDIVGVCLLMEALAPGKVIVSPVHTGSGFVRCSHGILPVPAPATAYLLTGARSYGGKIKGELCTPTGAAILKYLADDFGSMPDMRVEQIGYGMGKKDFEAANCVRVFWGESGEYDGGPNGYAVELNCNIDDMTGEALGYSCQILFDAGARDVYTTAAGMKKGRPGVLLTCVCDVEKADRFAALMLKHTTSFGVRKSVLHRYMLEREIEKKQTVFGEVRIKTGIGYGVKKSKLEYEDVAAMAKEQDCSIAEMERRIWGTFNFREVE